jgi:hypothetical protein
LLLPVLGLVLFHFYFIFSLQTSHLVRKRWTTYKNACSFRNIIL